jgi:hypothetical protein
MNERISEWKRRAGIEFWRYADKKIPKEWLAFCLIGLVLLAYVFILFFGTRPRK